MTTAMARAFEKAGGYRALGMVDPHRAKTALEAVHDADLSTMLRARLLCSQEKPYCGGCSEVVCHIKAGV
jgi:hypothetical protein